jgi:hypothetical protein
MVVVELVNEENKLSNSHPHSCQFSPAVNARGIEFYRTCRSRDADHNAAAITVPVAINHIIAIEASTIGLLQHCIID